MATGEHLLAARSYARASESFRQAITLRLDDARAHAQFAVALLHLKKLEEAAREIEIALKIEEEDAYFHYLSGAIALASNHWTQAYLSVTQAVSLQPLDASYHAMLASVLHIYCIRMPQDRPMMQKAEAAARRALELTPDNAETHRVLGHLLTIDGRKSEARAHFETALSLNPESAPGHNSLGQHLLWHGGDSQSALEHIEESLRHNPNDRWVQNTLPIARVWNATLGHIPRWLHKPLGIAILLLFGGWVLGTGWHILSKIPNPARTVILLGFGLILKVLNDCLEQSRRS